MIIKQQYIFLYDPSRGLGRELVVWVESLKLSVQVDLLVVAAPLHCCAVDLVIHFIYSWVVLSNASYFICIL